jgi:hypothetical protein
VGAALQQHPHRELVADYDHIHAGFAPERIDASLRQAGLEVVSCRVTARERRAPRFETISFHATKS